jgi:hypothetical protein
VRFDAAVPFTIEKARLKRELEHRITELYRSMEDEGKAVRWPAPGAAAGRD